MDTSNAMPPNYGAQATGSIQHMEDPYKAAEKAIAQEKAQGELALKIRIAEATTQWVHRHGATQVRAALRDWVAYLDSQPEPLDGDPNA